HIPPPPDPAPGSGGGGPEPGLGAGRNRGSGDAATLKGEAGGAGAPPVVTGPAGRPLGALAPLGPPWRLLVVMRGGAALVAFAAVAPLLWALALPYHAVLAWAIVRDARRLPLSNRFLASRQVPQPMSLGADQAVLVGISCPEAAGLCCEVADHAPAA